MHYLPWWVLLVCLVASALAAYLFLRRTQAGDSALALYSLAAALAPVVLLGAIVVAITLSTVLSALVEDQTGVTRNASEPPAPTERMSNRTTIADRTHPPTTEEQTTTTSTATATATSIATATATGSP